MSRELLPELSAVVVTPDCYASVRETVRRLRSQKVCACIEVVIVAPSARRYAAARSRFERWTLLRRLFYAVGTTLTPPLQLRSMLRETLRRGGRRGLPQPQVLPPVRLPVRLEPAVTGRLSTVGKFMRSPL